MMAGHRPAFMSLEYRHEKRPELSSTLLAELDARTFRLDFVWLRPCGRAAAILNNNSNCYAVRRPSSAATGPS